MGLPGLVGIVIRFIFVFRFSLKKMDKASRENSDSEKQKDAQVGLITIFVFIIGVIIWGAIWYP